MIRRPPRSTQSRSSAASDVYKRQAPHDRSVARRRLFAFGYPALGSLEGEQLCLQSSDLALLFLRQSSQSVQSADDAAVDIDLPGNIAINVEKDQAMRLIADHLPQTPQHGNTRCRGWREVGGGLRIGIDLVDHAQVVVESRVELAIVGLAQVCSLSLIHISEPTRLGMI